MAVPARSVGYRARIPLRRRGLRRRNQLYLRPKLGFCNCTTGVSDDAELDRVGDLELFSDKFNGTGRGAADQRRVDEGAQPALSGRRSPMASPRTALAIAFNDKCDVVVATVVADGTAPAAERAALDFLNGDLRPALGRSGARASDEIRRSSSFPASIASATWRAR